MEAGTIVFIFCIAILCLCVVLPLIRIRSTLLRWALKSIISVSFILLCWHFIQEASYVEPYIPDDNPTVYVTNTGDCYHNKGCRYLRSKNRTTLYDAFLEDYRPCSRCDPPELSESEKRKILESSEDSLPDIVYFSKSSAYIGSAICMVALIWLLLYFNIENKLSKLGHVYIAAFVNHFCILYGLFYFPVLIFAFTFGYTIVSVLTLLYVALSFVGKKISSLFSKKENIITQKITHDHPPDENPEPEPIYYMDAANGMTVRVPESKLDAWQAEQDRIRNSPDAAKLTEQEQRVVDAIVSNIYGPKE